MSGVRQLLDAGCLKIYCDARTVAQTGQLGVLEDRQRRGLLPLGSYSFSMLSIRDRKEFISGCLQEIQPLFSSSRLKDVGKLKQAIVGQLVEPLENLGQASITQLHSDLADNREIARVSLFRYLANEEHRNVKFTQVECVIEEVADRDYRVHTNLADLGFDEARAHSIVEKALLAVGGLNLRLEQMEAFHAMSGFKDRELPLFDSKLEFLARQMQPDAQVNRLHRVVELLGLPDFSGALSRGETVDIGDLLKLRDSDECREFRTWLRRLDQQTDREIKERVEGLRAKVSGALKSKGGRVARYAVVSAVGFFPPVGIALGPALGAVDAFALEKLLGDPGPVAFLTHGYRSLFDGK